MEKVQNTSTFHQRLCQTNQTTFFSMLIDFLDKYMVKITLSRLLKGILHSGILSVDTKMIYITELQRADNYMKERKQSVVVTKETGEDIAWQQESIF